MLLYTVKEGKYYNLDNFKKDLSDLGENGFPNKIYVNVTNRCSCSCIFCLRNTKEMNEENNLWLKEEPAPEEFITEFEKYDWSHVEEVVFCGFGEPTMNLNVTKVMEYCKKKHNTIPIRINTNGLGSLVHKKDISPMFEGLVDTVSISLNASNAEEYYRITRNPFGVESYEAMLKFAKECEKYVPNVVVTIVDCIGEEEIKACQKVCEEWNLNLRIRPFEK